LLKSKKINATINGEEIAPDGLNRRYSWMKMNRKIKCSKGSLSGAIIPLLILTAIAGVGWYKFYDEQTGNQTVNLANQKEKTELETDLKQSQSNVDSLESRQQQLDSQNKALNNKINNQQKNTESQNQRLSQLENSLTELRNEQLLVQDRNTTLETDLAAFSNQLMAAEDLNGSLEAVLAKEQEKVVFALENTTRLESTMQQMIDQVSIKSSELEKQLENRQALQASLSFQIDSVSEEKKALFDKLQDEQQHRRQLQNQVTQVNQNIDSKSDALLDATQGLQQLQKTLDEIRVQKDREAAEFIELKKQLEQELNQSQIQFTQLKNKMRVINLTSEVLFNSGSAEIKPAGQKVLLLIASTLNKYPNRQVFIEGHTDDIPMNNSSTYSSNWELSSARAISAAEILQKNNQVSPERLQVVGHSEFKPVISNETEEGRRLNRRIEIRLLPEPEKSSN